jgi:hypothetical protein
VMVSELFQRRYCGVICVTDRGCLHCDLSNRTRRVSQVLQVLAMRTGHVAAPSEIVSANTFVEEL